MRSSASTTAATRGDGSGRSPTASRRGSVVATTCTPTSTTTSTATPSRMRSGCRAYSAAMSVVLITGCNSGFGFHASLTFARQGHDVYATVRNLDRATPLHDAAEAEGLELHVLRLDVRDGESVAAAVAEVIEREGRIDVCVNNAGVEVRGPIEDC